MKQRAQKHLETLNREMEILWQELAAYPEGTLNRQPGPGRWSVIQIIHHLMKSEGLSLQYVQKKLSFNPELPPTGFSDHWRLFLVWATLNAPLLKFKAPAPVSGKNLPDQASLEETRNSWLAQRQTLSDYLDGLPADIFTKQLYKHPFAGKMSLSHMLRFFLIHFQRHKQQIKRTLRQVA